MHQLVHTPRAEFTFPLTLPSFRFLSHRASTGTFHLVQDLNPEGNARVQVLPTDRGSKSVRVCAFTRPQESEHGIFIHVSSFSFPFLFRTRAQESHSPCQPSHDLLISFNMTLHLPKPAHEGSKIYINSLNLDLPLFNHTIADIGPTVEFGTILFKTGPGDLPVTVQSLSAAKAWISTINSHISGNFSVGEELALSTTNGKISANIVLENDARKGKGSRLIMAPSPRGAMMPPRGSPRSASFAVSQIGNRDYLSILGW